MKKILYLMLVAILCISMIVGCSAEKVPEKNEPNASTSEDENISQEGFLFEEQVVYDKDGVKMTACNLFFDDSGLHFYYEIEDEQGRNLALSVNSGIGYVINDCRFPPTIDYPDDDTKNGAFFKKNELEFFQISDIFSFEICDAVIFERDTYDSVTDKFDVVLEIKNNKKQPEIEFDGQLLYAKEGIEAYFMFAPMGVHGETVPTIAVKNNSNEEVVVFLTNIRRDDEAVKEPEVVAVLAYPNTSDASSIVRFVETTYDADYSDVQKATMDIVIAAPNGTEYDRIAGFEIDWQAWKESKE